jgi:hypothetical protein
MEEKIIRLLSRKGPLLGSDLHGELGGEGLLLWRACMLSEKVKIRRVGTRYLRLDRRVEGYGRLSPSIWREFLTYSVVGLPEDHLAIDHRCAEVRSHIEEVSRSKVELAYRIFSALSGNLEKEWPEYRIAFVIAGDIVYNMAHDVPRPERSTGKMVKGSDLDMVVMIDDDCPQDLRKRLDESIYREKYGLLITPHIREEIDYIIKDLSKFREQLAFDTFKHMVACKIMHEGTLLCGSEDLFCRIKGMLGKQGIVKRLNELERRARRFRDYAEDYLLREDPKTIKEDRLYLFYPTEESEEFE